MVKSDTAVGGVSVGLTIVQRVDGVDHQLEEAVAELGARVEHGGAGSTSARLGRLGSRRVLQGKNKRKAMSVQLVNFFFII